MLVKFLRGDTGHHQDGKVELENEFTVYISEEKLEKLDEIVNKLPLIISKDRNVSTSIYLAINSDKKKKFEQEKYKMNQFQVEGFEPDRPLLGRHNPYLHKLIELIYSNIKCRFQVFGNAFCYFDFKNRQAVSFDDFLQGLEGFSIKMSRHDAKSVFAYLTSKDDHTLKDTTLMKFEEFLKLQGE